MSERVAVVTGAAAGIGRASALAFRAAGDRVALQRTSARTSRARHVPRESAEFVERLHVVDQAWSVPPDHVRAG